jgi:uncharacterized protein (DUF983 family)
MKCCPTCGIFNAFHEALYVKCYDCGAWLQRHRLGTDAAGFPIWEVSLASITDIPVDVYHSAEELFAEAQEDSSPPKRNHAN